MKGWPEGEQRKFRMVLLFQKASRRSARNGSEFLMVECGDRTGTITSTVFSNTPPFEVFGSLEPGVAIEVEGQSDHYQGRFSPKFTYVRAIDPEEVERFNLHMQLVETPPDAASSLWEELMGYVGEIPHAGLRETVETALEQQAERFRLTPAAISMHHAYRHGLLEHTTRIARAVKALLPLYPEVDPSLAMAGAILHDIGKALEYQGDDAATKTRAGIFQGHVVLGYRLARGAALKVKLEESLLERLEHIILSHQGEIEWGAAAMASTPEAVFVSMIDSMDAKMGVVQRELRNAAPGVEFSDFMPALQAKVYLPKPETE